MNYRFPVCLVAILAVVGIAASARPGWRLLRLPFHQGGVLALTMSPDARTVATLSMEGTVRLWDVTSGKAQVVEMDVASGEHVLAFSTDSKVLAVGLPTGRIRLVSDGRVQPDLEGHGGPVTALAFAPTLLASGSRDGRVILWDLRIHRPVSAIEAQGPVTALAFAPGGRQLAAGLQNDGDVGRPVTLYDVASGQPVRELPRVPSDHPARSAFTGAAPNALAFSADGRWLAASTELTVDLWDLASGEKVLQHFVDREASMRVRLAAGVAFDRTALHAVTIRGIESWSLPSLETGAPVSLEVRDASGVEHLLYAAHDLVLTGLNQGWQLSSMSTGNQKVRNAVPHRGSRCVAFDASSVAVSGHDDGALCFWDPRVPALKQTAAAHDGEVRAVLFTPDGRIVTVSEDKTAKVWTADGRKALRTIDFDGPAMAADLSKDGRRLAVLAARRDKTMEVRVLDAETAAPVGAWPAPAGTCVAFSADGLRIACGSDDGRLRVWRVDEPALPPDVPEIREKVGPITSVRFSPDGRWLAATEAFHGPSRTHFWAGLKYHGTVESDDNGAQDVRFYQGLACVSNLASTVTFWDPATLQARGRLEGRAGYGFGLAISADGRFLAMSCAGQYPAVLMWEQAAK